MVPLIAGLLQAGLSLAANAALAKGKQYLEEKTGLKIDETKQPTEVELTAYKKAEMDHEEEMAKIRQEDNKLDAYVQEMFLKDTQDARKSYVEIATSEAAPLLNKIINPVLSLIVTIGGGVILQINPDAEVKYAVVSIMMLVLGYHFGTSAGSTKANQMFRDMLRKNGSS